MKRCIETKIMDNTVVQQLYAFIIPHLHQQNINDGMTLLLKLNELIKNLENKNNILNTKNEYLLKENEYLRTTNQENKVAFLDLKRDIQVLSNTNSMNMLQMTKNQLEEMRNEQTKKRKIEDKEVSLVVQQPNTFSPA